MSALDHCHRFKAELVYSSPTDQLSEHCHDLRQNFFLPHKHHLRDELASAVDQPGSDTGLAKSTIRLIVLMKTHHFALLFLGH